MTENKAPSLIDKHVGRRVRWRRRELKLSQDRLGSILGLTFQQIQKYEKGTNRISSGRLFDIARALGTPINYFFQGAEEVGLATGNVVADSVPSEGLTGLLDSDSVDLIVAFQSIPDERLRKSILTMVHNSAGAFKADKLKTEKTPPDEK